MRPRGAAAVLALLAAGTVAGCGLRSPPVDAAAWVDAAAAASRRADQACDRGDREAARAVLTALARGPVAAGVAAADRRAVRMDALYRLAVIELEDARPAAALPLADEGLALGAGRDVFSANLHLARARALEALGVDLEAAASYHRALVVTEALLGTALDPGSGGNP